MKNSIIYLFVFITSISFAQQTDYVDFERIEALISFDPEVSTVYGEGAWFFEVLKPVDSIFIDAKGLKNGNEFPDWMNDNLETTYDGEKIWIKGDFEVGRIYEYKIKYEVVPKKALYFLKVKNDWNIWSQGQGKYTSNWLPSFDDVNEKVIFDLAFQFRPEYELISNGVLKSKTYDKHLANNHFLFNMKKPMSSYLVALAIGKYNKKTETSKSGIPLEYYYYPEDSLKFESTYRYSKQMFDFLEEEIGFPFPWQNYKQVPVHDFLYSGMENTSLTIFSDAFVVDSIGFNDKNYVNVNAHELAHQWFGDLVTAKSGKHHWLQEGFATYYALLAEREIFGDDYFYFKLLENVLDLSRQDLTGNGTSLLDEKASSLTFYQRGAFVLHALKYKVGDAVFKKAVKNYLTKYQFGNVETKDFIAEVQKVYGKSLRSFVNYWIVSKDFPYEQAFEILKKQSVFVNEYAIVDCEAQSSKCAEQLKYYISDEAKAKIISQVPDLVTADTFKNGLKVRQAIAQHVTNIPLALKSEYETLLDDKSYVTIETALYNLWTSFPADRAKYLSKTRDVVGFSDKNVRLLWIVLNLNTPFYEADNKYDLFNELKQYTGEKYNAELRMSAFNYLYLMKSCDEDCISELEKAKSHHNWRMVKFAKDLIKKIEENKN
ncbi:M1 family metallopeptidase [Winogradskyella eckloniae]|uniref:M1 family metallopeptidase n=1 Tax=Winogradskyella eckloniae TaxID=1089306 RepID=UPI001564D86A|nr:M1 family metallopeptidase [Winogradskyella eckloniae]NRD21376.1 M1 family metallopeptidase [Winogradskyella eckloniae]